MEVEGSEAQGHPVNATRLRGGVAEESGRPLPDADSQVIPVDYLLTL